MCCRRGCRTYWVSWLVRRRDGLLALSVGVGLGVLSEMMEAELDEVVGPKHANIAERTAVRHGHDDGEVTLGGRRIAVLAPAGTSA
jgi:putative transposase